MEAAEQLATAAPAHRPAPPPPTSHRTLTPRAAKAEEHEQLRDAVLGASFEAPSACASSSFGQAIYAQNTPERSLNLRNHPSRSSSSAAAVAQRRTAAAAVASGRFDAALAANPALREQLASMGIDLDAARRAAEQSKASSPASRFASYSTSPRFRGGGGGPPASSRRSASSSIKDIGGANTAARALLHPDFVEEEEPWVEPRTQRERELHLKLNRTLQALHRCRDELRSRAAVALPSDAAAGVPTEAASASPRGGEPKPDWSLALRFRLTSELRAELEQMETGWRADRQRHLDEVARLERALSKERTDKEQAVTQLTKDLIVLQRMYASESVQGRAMWAVLTPEIRHAERAHEWHTDQLKSQNDELRLILAQQTTALQEELARQKAALATALEDLADERARTQQMQATHARETERLQATLDGRMRDLEDSRQQHRTDVNELRRQVRRGEDELEQVRRTLTTELAGTRQNAERTERELRSEIEHLHAQQREQQAVAKAALVASEQRRLAEGRTLSARVSHLRQLQQEALEFIPSGPGRQMLYMESLKATKPDSPYTRGMDPPGAKGAAAGPAAPSAPPKAAAAAAGATSTPSATAGSASKGRSSTGEGGAHPKHAAPVRRPPVAEGGGNGWTSSVSAAGAAEPPKRTPRVGFAARSEADRRR